jgi:hypothetical protein
MISCMVFANVEVRPEPVFVIVYGAQESIPSAYVARRAGTKNRVFVLARQAVNRFLGSSNGIQIRALLPPKGIAEWGVGHVVVVLSNFRGRLSPNFQTFKESSLCSLSPNL